MKSDVDSGKYAEATTIRGSSSSLQSNGGSHKLAVGSSIPWQERPAGSRDLVWRHMPGVQGVYNSAVAPYGDGFVGVFRLEKRDRFPHLHVGWSDDGPDWHIAPEPVRFDSGDPGLESDYAYDPRVCIIGDTYYVTWCGGYNSPTISVASTRDCCSFARMENAFFCRLTVMACEDQRQV